MEHPRLIVVEWGELRYKSKVKFFNEVKKTSKELLSALIQLRKNATITDYFAFISHTSVIFQSQAEVGLPLFLHLFLSHLPWPGGYESPGNGRKST